jgi:EAL domain-containing protein (putative c-di-GMP-specific phosphodiesterase class I)/tetratricopeptide (TPR) repeat protein
VNEKLRSLCTTFLALPSRVAGVLLQDAMAQRLAVAGDRARQRGRYARAARLYGEALDLARRYGADDRWWGSTCTSLALSYSRLGKYIEAEVLHRRALEIYEKVEHLEQPRMASCLSNLGALHYHLGKYAEAELFYQRALTIQESVLGPMHPEVGVDLSNLAAICSQQRRYEEAEPLLHRALAIQEQELGLDHPDVATTLNNLGCLYQEQGRGAEAEALFRRALMVMQSARGADHPDTVTYCNNLALLCAEQGRDEAAEPLYRQALAIRRKALGPAHPDLATSMENYASLLEATLRCDAADRLMSQAKAIRARHAEDLLACRWSALPLSADRSADEEPPDWVTRLSAAAARTVSGSTWHAGSGGTCIERKGTSSARGTNRGDRHSGGSVGVLERHEVSGSPSFAPAESLEDQLQRAVDRNELQVYYQPVVSLASGQITGAEALLRWQHPRRGLLSPIDFVPLAQETGLMMRIGEWLLRDTCAQQTAWSEAGLGELRLLVNLSERELQDYRLPELIRDVLRATGTTPSALQLEVTERVALQDVSSTEKALWALTATGVRVALDDAGTNPGLLAHLAQLPVNAVKLDGALVRRMASDPEAAGVIEAIIARAHSLDLEVIALGVETEEQLALVRAHQCDEAQGYLFRRAVPADLFTLFLQDKVLT